MQVGECSCDTVGLRAGPFAFILLYFAFCLIALCSSACFVSFCFGFIYALLSSLSFVSFTTFTFYISITL